MKTSALRKAVRIGAASLVVLFGGVAWADTNPNPEIRRPGATVIVYSGPQVNLALSYKFARQNPGAQWLMLDAAMTSAREPIEVVREAFSVRTPSGEVVPLLSIEQFLNSYGQLGPGILRDNATMEPMGYLLPRRSKPIQLFSPRGVGLVWPSVWLDQWHNNYGRLYFQVPGGVQKGNYELLIKLSKSQVVIPFTI